MHFSTSDPFPHMQFGRDCSRSVQRELQSMVHTYVVLVWLSTFYIVVIVSF